MTEYKKTVQFGKIDYLGNGRKSNAVEIEVEIRSDGELSICGSIWNHLHTDCYSCGQNIDTIARLLPTYKKVQRIHEIWKRWHLNHMRAGTPVQMAFIEAHRTEYPGYPTDYYEWACELLKHAGIYEDNGYRYGTKWLKEELPPEIIVEVKSW